MTLANKPHRAIGVMSGTSLDGVDIVACEFQQTGNSWSYKIVESYTVDYPDDIYQLLKSSHKLSGFELTQLNVYYGRFLGQIVKTFIDTTDFKPEHIASSGYTVFHEPNNGVTMQIGLGAEIASITEIKTVCDFRTKDVALGGQGAPLVPIGDKLLFDEYTACLNLGGFSNISFAGEYGKREAFDICPVNFVLNHFAQKLGQPFDKNGELGKSGHVISDLLKSLNQIEYYTIQPPKSLGREFVESQILPLFSDKILNCNALRTFYEHIAIQLSKTLQQFDTKTILTTGGGVHNTFLMELLKMQTNAEIVVPKKEIVDYKEALVFAFLGLLRLNNKPNCLSSVTGAKNDNIGGTVYL